MEPMKPMSPMKPMEPMKPMQGGKPWWPGDLGQPSSSGGQGGLRYAYFSDRNRLVVEQDGKVSQYDTAGHKVTGVQASGGTVTVTGEGGTVSLDSLKQAP